METTQTSWGYAISSSGGTATAALTTIANKSVKLKIGSIAIGWLGAQTTADNVTVTDANDVRIIGPVSATAGTALGPTIYNWPNGLNTEGLKVGVAGTTIGYCSVFLAN